MSLEKDPKFAVAETSDIEDGVSRSSSNFSAYLSIVCMIAGAGTLGMPSSFKDGGWISVFFIFLSGTVAWYTGVLLVECIYYRPGYRLPDYPSVGEAAFGKFGRSFVMVFHYSIMLGVATLFIMLSGLNLHQLSQHHNLDVSLRVWIACAGLAIMLPYIAVKSMKEVAWMSIAGVLTTIITVIIASITGLIDMSNRQAGALAIEHQPINWTGVPASLATIGFSFGGTVIYTHVEGTMRTPKRWPYVLAAALGSVSIMYLTMGVVGYFVYGHTVKSPILNSLPSGAPSDLCFIIITLHLIAAAPLPLTSFSVEIERMFNINSVALTPAKERLVRLTMRVCLVCLLTLIAAFLPYFGDFMSLVGAISNLVLVYVTPVVCHLQLFGWRGRSIFTYLAMTICLLMGFFGGVLGAIAAIKSLSENVAKDWS